MSWCALFASFAVYIHINYIYSQLLSLNDHTSIVLRLRKRLGGHVHYWSGEIFCTCTRFALQLKRATFRLQALKFAFDSWIAESFG